MPRTRASTELRKRRAANLESYHLNADRHDKKRYCKRIVTGAVSRMQLYTLEKYDMTPDDLNNIREANGLPPLPKPHDIGPPCLLPKIEVLFGRRHIDARGVTTEKTLSQKTINNYAGTMKRLVKVILKCSSSEFVKCLKEADRVIRGIESRYTSSSTKRDYFARIFSPSKHIPECKAAIGDEALAKYHARMPMHAKATGEQTAEPTGNETVLEISVIKSRLPAVKEKFGAASAEYIAAFLQTNLWGLRAEPGNVKVINRESQARTYPNYYLRLEGKLVVRKFKTMQQFSDKPYVFDLNESLK
eukprot:jgi/Tetstr1/423702/TSEL_014336.t1